MQKREYKLIGCFDEDPAWLIYKLKSQLFVVINTDSVDEDGENAIRVLPNWLSPMRLWDVSITFFETSPHDAHAREAFEHFKDYIESQIEIVEKQNPRDAKLIREMANLRKHAKPNEPVFW